MITHHAEAIPASKGCGMKEDIGIPGFVFDGSAAVSEPLAKPKNTTLLLSSKLLFTQIWGLRGALNKSVGFYPSSAMKSCGAQGCVWMAHLAEVAVQHAVLLHIHIRGLEYAEIFQWLLRCLFAMCLNKYPICKICGNGAWKLDVQLHVLLTQSLSAYHRTGHLAGKFY